MTYLLLFDRAHPSASSSLFLESKGGSELLTGTSSCSECHSGISEAPGLDSVAALNLEIKFWGVLKDTEVSCTFSVRFS